MINNAELKILKSGSDSKENGKSGWITVSGGLKLIFYGIDIRTDAYILTIPIIFVTD